jgi:hypothetical protein
MWLDLVPSPIVFVLLVCAQQSVTHSLLPPPLRGRVGERGSFWHELNFCPCEGSSERVSDLAGASRRNDEGEVLMQSYAAYPAAARTCVNARPRARPPPA